MASKNTSIHDNDSLSYSLTEKSVIVLANLLVLLVAVPANVLVVAVIAKVQAMHTPTNLILLNLCVADLIHALLYLPFTTIDLYVTGYWIFGDFMCRLVSFLHLLAFTTSILFLIAIAIERYRRVCMQGRSQLTIKQTWIILSILWLLGILGSCPLLVVKYLSPIAQGEHMCAEAWPWEDADKVYTLVMFALFYVMPLAFLIIIYVRIARKFWKSTTRTQSMRRHHQRSTASKSKLTIISMVLVLSFALSWAPSHALLLWYYFRDLNATYPAELVAVLYPIISWVASSNCALNPLLYCFMSQNFWASYKDLWKRSSRNKYFSDTNASSKLSKRQSKELENKPANLSLLTEVERKEHAFCIHYESSV